ncbi:DNA-3-methyladenine glycosylase [Lactobacillaceae bacterium Melli_B3]
MDETIISQVKNFFDHRPTEQIAADCLGRKLTYESPDGTMAGYIVETEAYLGQFDSTAHAFKGRRTKANEPLYGQPGTVFVYSMHGQFLFNVITQAVDVPQGILIRAIEPCAGIDLMQHNRGKTGPALTNGPGKLMRAFGPLGKQWNERFVNTVPFKIDLNAKRAIQQVATSARIGVNQDGHSASLPLRFYVVGNPYVSGMLKRNVRNDHGWQN